VALGEVAARRPGARDRRRREAAPAPSGGPRGGAVFERRGRRTNPAKPARPSKIWVHIGCRSRNAYVEVLDDGVGGASLEQGSGLRGLTDRLATVGATIRTASPPGGGTSLVAEAPLAASRRAARGPRSSRG
jgi:hypothetical protein